MNGTQGNGNKRKSTRLLLDEDNNAPPTKKARGDVPIKSASAHAPNGAKSAGTRPTTNVRTRATRKGESICDTEEGRGGQARPGRISKAMLGLGS